MKLADLAKATRYIPIELEVAGQPLKIEIKLPLKAEIEAIRLAYSTPDERLVDEEYNHLSEPILAVLAQLKESGDESPAEALGISQEGNDTYVKNSEGVKVSLRTVAKHNVSNQIKTQLLFSLIKRDEGEPEPTYEDILEQLPESVARVIMAAIEEAIHPTYEAIRKK